MRGERSCPPLRPRSPGSPGPTARRASALNIIAQVIVLVNVYDINIWLVALGVGLLIMGIAVYVEFKREQLRTRSRQLTEALESWE